MLGTGTGSPYTVPFTGHILVPREFLCLGFDFGDGLCAAFGGIFVGEDDVHEYGTRDNGVDVLAEHLGLFAVADAETTENLGAMFTDCV